MVAVGPSAGSAVQIVVHGKVEISATRHRQLCLNFPCSRWNGELVASAVSSSTNGTSEGIHDFWQLWLTDSRGLVDRIMA